MELRCPVRSPLKGEILEHLGMALQMTDTSEWKSFSLPWPWSAGNVHARHPVPSVPASLLALHPACSPLPRIEVMATSPSKTCGCARSWALAPFHLFGEDELCQGHVKHHSEIIFGDRKLFSSRIEGYTTTIRARLLDTQNRQPT